ncbi:2'-5' RNA ligase family protein [Chitinophaga arvensicola]|uniref:2'-5' RNA ligase n=1 Tax=Chitinophaga arvensicola TaxID=29529 RepID=A0A1I0NKI1_9BACT|nr:2'-5' RNA ligase family protein [Chitinophaga arvensicola]SEW01913.1 2'-5' RNA ligase [Chitinophaga arvensicola]
MRRVNPNQLSLFHCEMTPARGASYFIILSPIERVKEVVKSAKEMLGSQIPLSGTNMKAVAHISLMKFTAADDDERIIKQIVSVLSSFPCFDVIVAGNITFKHGEESRSLVLKIDNPGPIQWLHMLLLSAFSPRSSKKITPHITIARSIPTADFEKIDLSAFNYHDSFLCQEITVLKKAPGDRKYKICFVMPLCK